MNFPFCITTLIRTIIAIINESKLGLANRITILVKQKINIALTKYENPKEALDYSYVKQVELLNRLRRGIAEVATAKKRIELQKTKLLDNARTLDEQARRALDGNREDLAKLALERKNANMLRLQSLDKQITEIKIEKEKLEQTEKRLSSKVEEFKSRKEIIKAQYSAAEAQVRIKESVTGISEEMADVGIAMSQAEDKTEKMKAKSQALDEMMESGVLTDSSSNNIDIIERELENLSIKGSVEEELVKLKAERTKKKKRTTSEQEEELKEESEKPEIVQ
jgi:phage shock protein A